MITTIFEIIRDTDEIIDDLIKVKFEQERLKAKQNSLVNELVNHNTTTKEFSNGKN